VVILEPSSNDILIGMAFLRLFKKALFLTSQMVFLVSENAIPEGADVADPTPKPMDASESS
jgi:hypothetical protein